jgi:hypothetical protein
MHGRLIVRIWGAGERLHFLRRTLTNNKERVLAKPNYSYEKRQKEIAKKKKKEDKKARKQEKPVDPAEEKETPSPVED